MLENIGADYKQFFALSRAQLPFMLNILAGLWIFNLINWFLLRSRLNLLGLYPRSLFGLVGIIFSPFLHADFNHLFFNTIPLFVLGMFILGLGPDVFIAATICIGLLSGITVWLVGRKYLHIGASGIISGYFGFVLCLAYLHPTVISLVLALVALYYFGSILAGILPTSEKVSWESHFIGLFSGLIVAYLFWHYPTLLADFS